MLDGLPGWAGLASDNSPSAVTISGEQAALRELAVRCEAERIDFDLLPISHGYHSRLIGAAVPAFQADLAGLAFSPPSVPVLSSVDGQYYQPEATPEFMPHHLARQLAIPVEFVRHVRKLYDDGVRLFVESGPRWSLTGFIAEILGPERPHAVCAAVHPKVGELEQFHRLLAAAFTWGRLRPEGLAAFAMERSAVPAAVVAPAALVQAPVMNGASAAADEVQEFIVAQLVEKTGYPAELLESNLDLEAELGIDTVKQVDVLAQAFGRFQVAPDRTLRVRNYNTIAKMAELIRERSAIVSSPAAPAPLVAVPAIFAEPVAVAAPVVAEVIAAPVVAAPVAVAAPVVAEVVAAPAAVVAPVEPAAIVQAPVMNGASAAAVDEVQEFIVAQLVEKTGYPAELLEADLDLEAELGIDTVKQVDVLAQAFGRFQVAPDRTLRVRNYNTIAKMAELIRERSAIVASPTASAPVIFAEPVSVAAPAVVAVPTIFAEPVAVAAPVVAEVVAAPVAVVAPVEPAALVQAPVMNGASLGDAADEVQEFIVAQLVEKTGYPAELLEADLDLEAELGIDTVKQVDVLAQAFGRFQVAPDRTLRVRNYNTIAKMAELIRERSAIVASPTASAPVILAEPVSVAAPAVVAVPTIFAEPVAVAAPVVAEVVAAPAAVVAPVEPAAVVQAPVMNGASAGADEVQEFIVAQLVEKTGYPAELLESDLDLEAELGIDTVKQVDVLAQAFGRFQVAPDRTLRVRNYNTIAKMAELIRERSAIVASPAVVAEAVSVAAPAVVAVPGIFAEPVAVAAPVVAEVIAAPMVAEPVVVAAPVVAEVVAAPAAAVAPVEPAAVVQAPVMNGASAPGADEVQEFIVAQLVEKTGYPAELLEADLDLEAELGIDTVKQVDVLAQAFGRFQVAPDRTLRVRNYNTIAKMAELIRERSSIVASPAAQAPAVVAVPAVVAEPVAVAAPVVAEVVAAPAPVAAPAAAVAPVEPAAVVQAPVMNGASAAADEVQEFIVAQLVEKTGYPAELLEADLDLEAELGIDTVKQVDVLAQAFGRFQVAPDRTLRVRNYNTIAKMAELIRERSAIVSSPAAPAPVAAEAPRAAEASVSPAPAVQKPEITVAAVPTHTVQAFIHKTPPAAQSPAPVQQPASNGAVAPADEARVRSFVLEAMAERTGYPVDELGLDLDVETDLGIDAVKQRAVFRQACEHFGIVAPDAVPLRELATLRATIDRVRALTGSAAAPCKQRPSYDIPAVRGELQAARYVPTAVPTPLERTPAYRLQGRRILVTVDPFGVFRALQARLEAGGAQVVTVYPRESGWKLPAGARTVDFAAPDQVRALMHAIEAEEGPLDGVFHLHALTPQPRFADMGADDLERLVEQSALCGLAMAQPLYDRFEGAAPGETFFVAATHLGACLGLGEGELSNPACGAWAGFLKSLRRELPGTLAKVVDFDGLHPVDEAAGRILDEVLCLDPAAEVGYVDDVRHTIVLVRSDRVDGPAPLEVDEDWVFVVSGGGRGVVAAVIRQLAAQFGATVYVTGRTPAPEGTEPWLAMDDAEFAAWRGTFLAAERAADPGASMQQLQRRYSAMKSARELHANLRDFASLRGQVHYRVCDVTRRDEVDALVAEVRARHGRIDGVVHGAMVEESRLLPRKTDALCRTTFAAKFHGGVHLLQATLADQPRLVVNFGSGASRFGSHGQSDYASAGDLLAKATRLYRREMAPDARCITIDWPAWLGAGWVASNPEIERLLRENGVGTFIELDEGVAWFVGEMLYGTDEEVVIAGDAMVAGLAADATAAWDAAAVGAAS
jgi:malonyl CoA-acyl carrier protein transacylase